MQLEHEIFRESFYISFYRFIQVAIGYIVQLR